MKRAIANYVVIAVSALSFAASAGLVENPSFENGYAGWKRAKDVFSIKKGEGYNGTCGLVYKNDSINRYCFPFQKIKLVPGERYLVEGKVMTKNLVGKSIGAGICIEWNNASDGWMGAASSPGLKGTTDGWVKVAFTADVPASAKIAYTLVAPFVRRGMTGEAWFDDLSVTPLRRAPIESFISSAYRNACESGRVSFLATLNNIDDVKKFKGEFVVETVSGRKTFSPEVFNSGYAKMVLDTLDFPIGTSTVDFILRDAAGKQIAKKSLSFHRFAKGGDKRKVRFDSKWRMILNGKPFFPIGISIDRVNPERLENLRKASINTVSFSEYQTGTKAEFDLCEKYGIKACGGMQTFYSGTGRSVSIKYKTQKDADDAVVAHVNKLKDHPALLAWTMNDELGTHLIDMITARRKLFEKLDPDHPTYSALYQVDEMRRYLEAIDAVGSDPYPIGSTTDYPMSLPSKWTKMTCDGTFGMRPVWQIPQIFDWSVHKKVHDPRMRAPTFEEMRNMAWQCIVLGANGLVFYSYHSLVWADRKGKDPFEKRWADVCRMTNEIANHVPGLLSSEPVPHVDAGNSGLLVKGWRIGGKTWIACVNPERTSVSGVVRVDGVEHARSMPPLGVSITELPVKE